MTRLSIYVICVAIAVLVFSGVGVCAQTDLKQISDSGFTVSYPEGMEAQATRIASWGEHVYVKIPVTNTKREKANATVERLSKDGIQLNVTALMTVAQVAGGYYSSLALGNTMAPTFVVQPTNTTVTALGTATFSAVVNRGKRW